METNEQNSTTPIPGISINVKYNLIRELEKSEKNVKENNQLKEKALKRLREMKDCDRVISDDELLDLLEEYRDMSEESKFWFVETEYTDEEYMDEYLKLCEDVKRDYHKDGKIEFIYDPSVRNAISDRNCELR